MKKKYYYDCLIQALYMHIEFGVKFDTEVKISADLSNDNYLKNMTPDITKIYVKPESEDIFEPKGNTGRWYQNNDKHFFNPKEEN